MRVANNFSTAKAQNSPLAVTICQQEVFLGSILKVLKDPTLLKGNEIQIMKF